MTVSGYLYGVDCGVKLLYGVQRDNMGLVRDMPMIGVTWSWVSGLSVMSSYLIA